MNSELLADGTIFYKYTSTKGACATLVNEAIRLSPLDKLNDPFELYNMKLMDFNEDELKARILDKIIAYVFGEITFPYPSLFSENGLKEFKQEFDKNPNESKDEVRKNLTPFVEDFIKNYNSTSEIIAKKLWDEIYASFVVFCTTTSPDNIKMLSHYADGHKGVVIGFQGLKNLDSALLASKPINYQDTPPVLHSMDEYIKRIFGEEIIDYKEAGSKIVFTKHTSWAEEKEMRLAYPAKDLHTDGYKYIKIALEEIHSIYFGCKIAAEEKNLIMKLLKLQYPHVKQYDLVENRALNRFDIIPLLD